MLSCLFNAALWSPAGKGTSLGSLLCDVLLCFVTFPCGVLSRVWYLIVSIPNLCLFTYFVLYILLGAKMLYGILYATRRLSVLFNSLL